MAYYHENQTDVKREVSAYLGGSEFNLGLLITITQNTYPEGDTIGSLLDLFWESYSLVHNRKDASKVNNNLRSLL
ncbi:MAG: hypothetical protein ABIB79_01075 [archaeon]